MELEISLDGLMVFCNLLEHDSDNKAMHILVDGRPVGIYSTDKYKLKFIRKNNHSKSYHLVEL